MSKTTFSPQGYNGLDGKLTWQIARRNGVLHAPAEGLAVTSLYLSYSFAEKSSSRQKRPLRYAAIDIQPSTNDPNKVNDLKVVVCFLVHNSAKSGRKAKIQEPP